MDKCDDLLAEEARLNVNKAETQTKNNMKQ